MPTRAHSILHPPLVPHGTGGQAHGSACEACSQSAAWAASSRRVSALPDKPVSLPESGRLEGVAERIMSSSSSFASIAGLTQAPSLPQCPCLWKEGAGLTHCLIPTPAQVVWFAGVMLSLIFLLPAGCPGSQGLLRPPDHLDGVCPQLSVPTRGRARRTQSQNDPHPETSDPGWQWEGLGWPTGPARGSG